MGFGHRVCVPRLSRRTLRILQELRQKQAYFVRLLLLHPVTGAIDEMTADHVGASLGLHRLKDARALIGAPVLLAGDESGRHVDGATSPGL